MLTEFLLPLDRQFDSGFMSTAHAFHEAAKALDQNIKNSGLGMSGSRLPILYLFRHAIELHFKSILTIMHRRFGPSYPKIDRKDFPTIAIGSKRKRLFHVHSIRALCNGFLEMLKKNETTIKKIAKTDWTAVPDDLGNWVTIIDEADKASTMFRYPFTTDPATDKMKSAFKSMQPIDVAKETHARSDDDSLGLMIMALKNDKNEIVETFVRDDEAMADVYNALKQLADMLTGVNLGLLYELVKS